MKPIATLLVFALALMGICLALAGCHSHKAGMGRASPSHSIGHTTLQYTEHIVTLHMAGVKTAAEEYTPTANGTHPAMILL